MERDLIRNSTNYQTMADTLTDKNSLPKSLTELV